MLLWKLILLKTKILTTVDDYIRLVTMTGLALLLGFWLDISGLPLMILVSIGIAIDIHDLAMKFVEEKPLM